MIVVSDSKTKEEARCDHGVIAAARVCIDPLETTIRSGRPHTSPMQKRLCFCLLIMLVPDSTCIECAFYVESTASIISLATSSFAPLSPFCRLRPMFSEHSSQPLFKPRLCFSIAFVESACFLVTHRQQIGWRFVVLHPNRQYCNDTCHACLGKLNGIVLESYRIKTARRNVELWAICDFVARRVPTSEVA
jgi:hypothetical protein